MKKVMIILIVFLLVGTIVTVLLQLGDTEVTALTYEEFRAEYTSCIANDRGEWCCYQKYEGDKLIEETCRQFPLGESNE